MDKRSILIGLGVLAVGAVLGAVLVSLLRPAPPAPDRDGSEALALRPSVTEPVRIGDQDPPLPEAVPELTSLNQLFKGVAQRVTPTVVFIEVETPADQRGARRDPSFEQWHPFVQPRRYRRSAGSGVIISPRGYVVTNAHVVDQATRIRVLLGDKREFEAEIVGVDPTTDLAVVHMPDADGADLPVVTLGDSDLLDVGEWVLAIGNPFRLTSTVTSGIVSALGRQVDIIEDDFRIEDFIQTDAAINPGNSGGALVNLRGELVGIATAIATESGSYEGYGFAVPVNLVTRVATDLIAFGEVQRGYLGVEIRAVTAADAERLGLGRVAGVLVSNVADDGAAERAGVRSGDVLLAINGQEIDAPNQFQSAIALQRPNDDIRLSVWRGGGQRDLDARLIGRDNDALQSWIAEIGGRGQLLDPEPPRPEPAPEQSAPDDLNLYELDAWGIGLRDLTVADRGNYGLENGVYVAFVRQGSVASADGLPAGSVLTAIEGDAVTSAEEASAALDAIAAAGGTALVRVRRADGVTAYYDLESPAYAER
ncbi:MAG: trypsin-like peptidase domain-containing protein [Bacteroidota bacterium]